MALISVSLICQPDTSLHCETTTCASCGMPSVYIPAFAETHCAYQRRDGQAELTWNYVLHHLFVHHADVQTETQEI